MSAEDRQQRARRKILNILPRAALEEMANTDRPWAMDRKDLVLFCMSKWDREIVHKQLSLIFDTASRVPEGTP